MTMMNAAAMNAAAASPGDTVENVLKRLLSNAAADPGLRRRMLADPVEVLSAAGLTLADGVTVTVEETLATETASVLSRCTATSIVLPLPAVNGGDVSDEELDAVAGGGPFNAIMNAITLPVITLAAFLQHGPAAAGGVAKELAGGVTRQWHDKSSA